MRCPSCGNENREAAKFCDSCGATLQEAKEPRTAPIDAEPLPSDIPPELADGRYRIRRFLGQGGRKRVYLAEDSQSGTDVAVAIFNTEGVAAAVQARARREAQAMGKLGDHPHVVRVYDTGVENGNPYIVSEYMAGGDVEELLDASDGRRLDVERAAGIAADVCRALEHAHGRGIVHRDLKPANIWLDDDGAARLGDFGLATTEGRSRVSEGALVGTVAYLPPEQALGKAAGPRSDLYSLGALLNEMLTGQPPFAGDDAVAIISQHLHADPVPPSGQNPQVPRPLDELVLSLLAKAEEDRPAGAADVRDRLAAAAAAPPADEEEEGAEEANPLDRLAGGVFVGREKELEKLRGAVDGALGGRGGLLLLVGEPGIGKTRTAEELATYAQVHGARVYWGRCREEEGAPAYWPWVQSIRSYVRDADPVALAWQMGGGAADIAQLVPEAGEHLGEQPEQPQLDPEQERFRMFDSVTTFLAATGRDRPLVFVLDDLHWADEPSLLLLRFLARELSGTGLLIVGTYRDVELGRHHPLARVLGELGAAESSQRITLRGLDADDVARYIEMTAGVGPPPALAEAVHDHTEGNPFFLAEVVRLLVSEGTLAEGNGAAASGSWELAIPQGVREVVGRRLDRLPPEANEVLTVAAAIGREFDLAVLEQASDQGADPVRTAVEGAVADRLVTEADSGDARFSFAHALVRETLYDEVSDARRLELHRRIGQALEERYAGDDEAHLDELAHHFLEAAPAGDRERAIDYATRAGAQAIDKLAYEEAVDDFGRALEVLELDGAPDEGERCRLLLELGEAQTRSGSLVPARETFERAANAARSLDDAESLARAAVGLGRVSEAGNVDQLIIDVVEEALAALPDGDSTVRAELLGVLSQEMVWVDARGKAAPLATDAVEMARRVGDPRTIASTLMRRVFVILGPGTGPERLRLADEMLELAASSDEPEYAVRGHFLRIRELLEIGDVPGVDREVKEFARLAGELRIPMWLWRVDALRAMRALIDGDLGAAERLADEARVGGERAQEPLAVQLYAIQLLEVRRFEGRVGELREPVAALAERYPAIPAWRMALTNVLALAGDVDAARVEFNRLAAKDFADVPEDAQWLAATTLLGEVCATVGDADRAKLLYEGILPYEDVSIVVGPSAVCQGPVARVLGLLAKTMSRHDDAERHFADAIELSTRMGDRPNQAISQLQLAELLLERDGRGDRDRALELLSECLESARQMGARGISDPALELRLEAQGLAGVDVTTSIDEVISAVESERPDLREHAAPDGTVTILFSDIEDSTLITERLGDERWLEELRAHNSIFRDQIRRHDGFEVKSQGDGFMLAFPDPCRALQCAIAVQRDFAAKVEEGEGEPLRVRMGLHTGEVIAEEGDFFGKNVILAARIAGRATGGEILVSSSLKEAADDDGTGGDGAGELRFDDGREIELKGLAGTHLVYRAEWEGEPQGAAA